MSRIAIALTILILFFAIISTRADTIVLQNGRTLTGEITSQADEYVEIRLGSGKMRLNRADIKSFEIKEPAEGYSKVDLPSLEKAGKPEEATAKNAGPVLKMDLEAEYVKGRIKVTGRSGLPRRTAVTVYFKSTDGVIAAKEAVTKNGNFYAAFGPFEKGLSAGEYIIEARAESKDKETVFGSRPLIIGTAAQVSMSESEERRKLAVTTKEVQSLYEELEKAYAENKENFDKKKWDEWSEEWFNRVNAQVRGYSGTDIVSLYPRAHSRLEACMHQIILLHTAYSLDLAVAAQEDGVKEDGRPHSPKLEPQTLKDSIDKGLAEARKEVPLVAAK